MSAISHKRALERGLEVSKRDHAASWTGFQQPRQGGLFRAHAHSQDNHRYLHAGYGGIEGIERTRAKWPNAKIIAISGGWPNMDKHKALEAARSVGADYALAKPFSEEELLEAVA